VTGAASFVITLVPYGKIDHAMMYKVDYKSHDTWESRLTAESLDFLNWNFGSALFYAKENVVYKLDYFKHYYFYSIDNTNGNLSHTIEIPNEAENLLKNGKISISQYDRFLYLFNIEC
jgi:hypothetical protein